MALTTPERITVNGVDVKTFCTNIETLAATLRIPAKRTGNVEAAGLHGVVHVPRKKYGPGHLIWPMWLIGADADGLVPGGSSERREFFKRVDELVLLMTGGDLLEIAHYLPDGTIRVINGEVLDTIDFTTAGVNPIAKVVFDIQTPSPFWTEQTQYTKIVELGRSWVPGTVYTFSELTGANAPIQDAVVEFWNPSSLITLLSGANQEVSFSVAGGTILSTEVIQVDSGSATIKKGPFTRVESRRNRAANASLEDATAGASGYAHNGGGGGTISRVTTGYCPHGASFGQTTVTSASAINMRMQPFSTTQFGLAGYVVGQQYTWSSYFRTRVGSTSASRQFRLRIVFWDATTALSTSETALTAVARAVNDTDSTYWTRLAVTATIPAGTTRVEMLMITDAPAVGDLLNWDALLIEGTATAGTVFDYSSYSASIEGAIATGPSVRYQGARYNTHTNPSAESNSIGYSNNGGVGGAIGQFNTGYIPSGSFWLKTIASGSGTINVFLLPFSDAEFHRSYEPGMAFTWSFYVRYMAGPGASRSVSLNADVYNSTTFLTSFSSGAVTVTKATDINAAAGWVRISMTGTLPSNTTKVGLYFVVAGAVATDEIHFDAVLIEPGSTLNAYGDGNTAGWRWDGTVNSSSSGAYSYNSLNPATLIPVTNYAPYSQSGSARFVELAPDASGLYKFTLTGSTSSDTLNDSRFIIRANRKFKTG